MSTFIKLAWRNMWRNWRRTTIALVAIILGLILLLLFDGMVIGSDQAIFGNAARLYGGNVQVHAPGYRAKASQLPMYPLEDAEAVVQATSALPEVMSAAKRINTGGMVTSGEGTFPVSITGLEPSIEAPVSIQAENISQGRFLLDDDGDAIVIGQGLADLLKVTVDDRVKLVGRSKQGDMRQRTMTVVGIYDVGMREAEEGAVLMSLPEAQTLYNLREQATEIAITLQDVGQETAVMTSLQATLPGSEVDTWQTLRPEIREMMDTKRSMTTVMGLMVVFIASIGILNLMMMAAFERTREMGILAALGMKGRQIMGLFLLEGALIGVVGAVVGCLLGGLMLGILGQVGIDYSAASGMGEVTALMGSRLYPSLSAVSIIVRGLIVVFIVMLASFYPAWQASRKEPAAALHHI